jgi:hypothetical protein
MYRNSRREFLANVGKGMLISSVGSAMAVDLGLAPAFAGDDDQSLSFGKLEPLVSMMQETPADELQSRLVEKLRAGAELRTIVAAAALANSRTFGGEDYVGFHTIMALAPALEMASELPESLRPLPVLKVVYRNANRIQEYGGRKSEVLHPVTAASLETGATGGEILRAAVRRADYDHAEQTFAALATHPVGEAFNHLQFAVQEEINVHRVVLAWRAWTLLDVTGQEHAHTLLRQSVRFCVNHEQLRLENKRAPSPIRTVLPKLLDQHRLLSRQFGRRKADDAWIDELGRTVFSSEREQAADAVAAALAEGFDPEDVGEAISVAANLLVLHDPGRSRAIINNGNKPVGSVHGDSVGVHASDAINAWRNIARVSNHRNAVASLIVGAYHTAGQTGYVNKTPYPLANHLSAVRADDPATLLKEADGAIREKDQFRACAVIQRYGELGHSARPVFDLFLRYATSENGALHGEKYYRTVTEEFVRTRAAFRWRQMVALARVTASEYGNPAPGYEQARELLGLT